jgi:nucleotide-binding universal stress UspA family protein
MSWLPKQNVVVPVDFSEQSIKAVDLALGLVEDTSHVHVVHVLPTISYVEPGVVWTAVDDDARRHHAELALKERLSGSQYEKVKLHVMIGDPGQAITELAAELKADLVVLPSHGRTGLRRLLIGSVAERVVRLAHCPVLVLRS